MNLDVTIGEPVVRGSLALFPVFSGAPSAPEYLTGPEAEGSGLLLFEELEAGPSVPEISVTNRADCAVLLIEGEQILGGLQNRTLNASALIPAGRSVTVPVSCVEAGRWHAPKAATRSRRNAPSDLRRIKTESALASRVAGREIRSDQRAVWDRVKAYAYDRRVVSGTAALEDVYASVDEELDELLASLSPQSDQCGVLVAIGGQPRALDLFDKPSTLAGYWEGLVSGYAMDALQNESNDSATVDVDGFLAQVTGAPDTQQPGVGLGTDRLLETDGLVGTALEWEGRVVHLAAFDRHNPEGRQRRIR